MGRNKRSYSQNRNNNDSGSGGGIPTRDTRIDTRKNPFEEARGGIDPVSSSEYTFLDLPIDTGIYADPRNPSSDTHSILLNSSVYMLRGKNLHSHDGAGNQFPFAGSRLHLILAEEIFPVIRNRAKRVMRPKQSDFPLTSSQIMEYTEEIIEAHSIYCTYNSIIACGTNPEVKNIALKELALSLDHSVSMYLSRYREAIVEHFIPERILDVLDVFYQTYTWNDSPGSPLFRFSYGEMLTHHYKAEFISGIPLLNAVKKLNSVSTDEVKNSLMSDGAHILGNAFPQWAITAVKEPSSTPLFAPSMNEVWYNQQTIVAEYVEGDTYKHIPSIEVTNDTKNNHVLYGMIGDKADPLAYLTSNIAWKTEPTTKTEWLTSTGVLNPWYYEGASFLKPDGNKWTNLSLYSRDTSHGGPGMIPLNLGSHAIFANIQVVPVWSNGWSILNAGNMEFKQAQHHGYSASKYAVDAFVRWLWDFSDSD